ncbi:hypothetical protein SLEP1_g42424 [Rubroshorea leprosula]|uniref:Uncharacterized protein n=1 Tax=Rubroshorea leprosula TaxID=152421 RepID=A0AAV5LA66_9ROSI|nr:hypothetical protein SLEP1_g42424 [Rubroshorea leprosula]
MYDFSDQGLKLISSSSLDFEEKYLTSFVGWKGNWMAGDCFLNTTSLQHLLVNYLKRDTSLDFVMRGLTLVSKKDRLEKI